MLFFYLFYFSVLFHSYLSLPIGARVIFWNSPSKLGSVQWTCGWRALESIGSESFEKICDEFEWRTSACYSWRRRKSQVGKRVDWQWIRWTVHWYKVQECMLNLKLGSRLLNCNALFSKSVSVIVFFLCNLRDAFHGQWVLRLQGLEGSGKIWTYVEALHEISSPWSRSPSNE